MSCRCNCHASSGTHRAPCNIANSGTGVPGVISCSPCNHELDPVGGGCGVCGAQARDGAYICDDCIGVVERAIGDVGSLLHEVSIVATKQARVYRANAQHPDVAAEQAWDEEQRQIPAMLRSKEGCTALPQTALMVDEHARQLTQDAWTVLMTSAMVVGADEMSSKRVVAWLLAHLGDLRVSEEAPRIYFDMLAMKRRLERAVDRAPSRVYAGPCHAELDGGHRCQRQVFGYRGEDIRCDGFRTGTTGDTGCGAVHTPDSREQWLLGELNDALLPLAQWQSTLPRMFRELSWPNRSTWWRWCESGQLLARAVIDGVDQYRGGDLIDLVVTRQQQIEANRNKRRSA